MRLLVAALILSGLAAGSLGAISIGFTGTWELHTPLSPLESGAGSDFKPVYSGENGQNELGITISDTDKPWDLSVSRTPDSSWPAWLTLEVLRSDDTWSEINENSTTFLSGTGAWSGVVHLCAHPLASGGARGFTTTLTFTVVER